MTTYTFLLLRWHFFHSPNPILFLLKGDSGGPMQIGTGNTWTQIGIVSWGIGCGKSHYPGVYTRVTDVKDWIEKIRKEY